VGPYAELKKPTIAVAKGNVHGGGIGMIAACDMTVAASDIFLNVVRSTLAFGRSLSLQFSASIGNKKALE